MPAETANEVHVAASGYAEKAAERFLVQALLIRDDIAPPKGAREREAWGERQRALWMEFQLAAIELERFLRIAELTRPSEAAEITPSESAPARPKP